MDLRTKYPNLKVIPVNDVEHKNFSDLVRIRGHQGYYVNCLSGKITFRKGSLKIPTGKVTIMEAKRYVEEFEKMRAGMSKDQAKRSTAGVLNPSVVTIWDEMIEQRKVEWESSTVDNYQTNWRNAIKPFWGDKFASDINEKNVMLFKKWYLTEKPTRYFGHTLSHLSVFLNFAKTMGYIGSVPDLQILQNVDEITTKNRGKEWQSDDKVFKDEEIERLLEASAKMRSDYKKSRARLGILLGVKFGMRKMEAMKMKWSESGRFAWVDLPKDVLHVWSYKNHKWREVPLIEDVKKALEHQRQFTGESEWVFPGTQDPGQHISSQVFDKVWVSCKKIAGVEGRFHDLRHTFATKTAELGWPPVVACSVLDMSLRIYQRKYAKPSVDSKHKWMMDTHK